MNNMSYCRFRNTLHDLRDCREALELLICGPVDDEGGALSNEEKRAAIDLVEECAHVLTLIADNAGLSLDTDDVERNIAQVINDANAEAKTAEALRDFNEQKNEDPDFGCEMDAPT